MRLRLTNRAYWCLMIALLAFAGSAFAISAAFGVRINTTTSMPIGMYRIADRHIARGTLVSVCLPTDNKMLDLMRTRGYEHAGTCASGLAPLIKPVVAIEGDAIELTDDAVLVNGKALPFSRTARVDGSGRLLPSWPRGSYHVPAGSVWLVSTYSPNSLDSRYFGPVPSSSIEHVLTRLY
jgi:conjugative transfer signal peptidase TraF